INASVALRTFRSPQWRWVVTTKLSGFDFDDNRSLHSGASSVAWLIARCLLIGLVGRSAHDGSGSTSFGSGAAPSGGCTKAPDCAACSDCFKQCVCETGQQQSCLQACGGGSGGSGNAGGTSSFGGMSGTGFGGAGGSSTTGGSGGIGTGGFS